MDVVTVGDVMIDVRVDADGLEEGGDVHGRVLVRPGGSAANVAVWAAESGASARVHGRVGSDVAGALLRDELIARGVEPALAMDPTADTGTMLVVHEPRERSMVADRGAGGRLSPTTCPIGSRRARSSSPVTPSCSNRPPRRAARLWIGPARSSWPWMRRRGR